MPSSYEHSFLLSLQNYGGRITLNVTVQAVTSKTTCASIDTKIPHKLYIQNAVSISLHLSFQELNSLDEKKLLIHPKALDVPEMFLVSFGMYIS